MSERYAELREAIRDATPGPWRGTTIGNYDQRHAAAAAFLTVMARREKDNPDIEFSDLSWVRTEGDDWLNVALVGNGANGPENARYIAAANPSVIAALLAERDALHEALTRIANNNATTDERAWFGLNDQTNRDGWWAWAVSVARTGIREES